MKFIRGDFKIYINYSYYLVFNARVDNFISVFNYERKLVRCWC